MRRLSGVGADGAGGNGGNCGGEGSHDAPHTTLGQLALAHGFALVCGEAIQWTPQGPAPGPTPGPSPGPVPADCLNCFEAHGCRPGMPPGPHGCDQCVVQKAQRACSHTCMPTPFGKAQHAFCHDHNDHAVAPAARGVCDKCHGGQWLIPDVQTTASGPKCAATDSLDVAYINNAIATLSKARHPDGSAVYDTSRVFSSGCSMGSAFSIFISNCLYGSLPKGHITAFATHSTGIKKKVRNTFDCFPTRS